MNKNHTLNYIKTENFVASKKLGQNFLINKDIKERIVKSADLTNIDWVVEIGPGLGSITEIILANNTINLQAIELDKRLHAYLKEKFDANPRFHIINDDFLKINLDELMQDKTDKKVAIIANLPYSISSKIIAKLCISKKVDHAIIMVQKEMAQRICAKVNSSNYNGFTAWLKLSTDIKFLFDVGPKNFVPPPKVWSTVVRIDFHNQYSSEQLEIYKNFFSKCFCSKRKTIINNLSNFYDKKLLVDIINKLNLSLTTRAEELNPNQLIEIHNFLNQQG